jgi:hypothetical protein
MPNFNIELRNPGAAHNISFGSPAGFNYPRFKTGGTFTELVNAKYKVGGSMVDLTGVKVKVGGTFVDLV